MSSLDTAKKGLELVEGLVYVGRDACERPQGLGSCVVLGFGDLPRYTGVIIFQEIVECSSGVIALFRKVEMGKGN